MRLGLARSAGARRWLAELTFTVKLPYGGGGRPLFRIAVSGREDSVSLADRGIQRARSMAPERSVQSLSVKLGQPWTREIVPGVFRVGTTFVGCYAIEDAGAYTFVDAGLPGYWRQMTGFLASRSAPLSAVKRWC